MKKLFALLLAVAMVFAVGACGKSSSSAPAETSQSGSESAPAADPVRIVYIINGTLGDKSFFDSGKEGLDMITAKYGDQVYTEYREMTYDSSLWESTTADIVAEGWDIVIAGTWDMLGYIGALAPEYPDTKFWFFDERWDFEATPADNVYGMVFAQNEGSYLVGMAAAATSANKQVAFMGGYQNTVLSDFAVGFTEGAKAYSPDTKVNISWSQSFSDASIGKDISLGLYQQGYDVVFACCGACGLGAFDAVLEAGDGKYVIGVDGDQAAYFESIGSKDKADKTITSMMKCVNNAFMDAMDKHMAGTLEYGTNAVLGLKGGFVDIPETSAVLSAEDMALINQAKQDIINGEIVVSTAFDMDPAVLNTYLDGTFGAVDEK